MKRAIGLPLLSKELTEQAARRRTYVARTVYALILCAIGFTAYTLILRDTSGSVYASLGRGKRLFEWLIGLQFVGIYLFMPALVSDAVAGEKERNSLVLLVLTRLKPGTILLEKFLGRVIPMLMIMLIFLPLLGIAYSLGGFTNTYLWNGVWLLGITLLQVGSFCLLCSCFFRTTVAAYIATYVLGTIYVFSPLILEWTGIQQLSWVLRPMTDFLFASKAQRFDHDMFLPAIIFVRFADQSAFGQIARYSCPTLVTSFLWLLLARIFLIKRAFVQPHNMLLATFRTLDAFFRRINENRITRGIVLVHEGSHLPGSEPLAWRETTKSALGAFRYLVRILIAMEIPIFFLGSFCVIANTGGNALTVLCFLLWIFTVLVVTVKSASLITSERSRETLDVLLTTPLTGIEIVQQKLKGVWRLLAVLSIPLFTIVLFKAWWNITTGFGYRSDRNGYVYVICALLCIATYLPMVSWMSLLFGLRLRNQTRAIFAALATLTAWCILPPLIYELLAGIFPFLWQSWMTNILLLSPATVIVANEEFWMQRFFGFAFAAVILNFLIYVPVLFVFRRACMRSVAHCLDRLETPVDTHGRLLEPGAPQAPVQPLGGHQP